MAIPYYRDEYVELYVGHCADVLREIDQRFNWVVTDPVWPDASPEMMAGAADPIGTFIAAASHFERLTDAIIVQLGCASDPRFLSQVPESFEFVRACWLGYSRPSIKARLAIDANIAYVFARPEVTLGSTNAVLRGLTIQRGAKVKFDWHPCPRQLPHVQWLLKSFVAQGSRILDPFCGSGTTLVAAKRAGLKAVGIEVDPKYAQEIVARLMATEAPTD